MNAHSKITPDTRAAFATNRAAIAAARQEAVFVIRQDCVKERQGLAATMVADAIRSGVPIDWEAYSREAAKIQAFYDERERKLFPVAAVSDAGSYDPVFDNTVASHRFFGRL